MYFMRYVIDKSFISTLIYKQHGIKNIFIQKMDSKYSDIVNDVFFDEPILCKMIQILVTRNNKQYKKFMSTFCNEELIQKYIGKVLVQMCDEMEYSYFSHVTLKIDWFKNVNHVSTKSIIVNNQIQNIIELHHPYIIYTYTTNEMNIIKMSINSNISLFIINMDDNNYKTITMLMNYNKQLINEYVYSIYDLHLKYIQSIEMKHILLLPTVNCTSLQSTTTSTEFATELNWINGYEYHKCNINQNGLIFGDEKQCYTVSTVIEEKISSDMRERENITHIVKNNYIMLVTLNERLLWYMISYD